MADTLVDEYGDTQILQGEHMTDQQRPAHLAHRDLVLSPHNARMDIVDAASAKVIMAVGEPPRRKVAIVGAGLGKQEAPYDDPEWEVWALNVCGAWDAQGRLRADRWFEMHEMHAQSEDDWAWIRKCPVPLYVVPQAFAGPGLVHRCVGQDRVLEAVPNAVRYPLEVVEELAGPYWACTFAYQIALALWEGAATDIGLYGVELAWGTERERTVEWANTSWWAGYAEGRGVRIHLPAASMLGRHLARYGVEYDQEIAAVKRYLRMVGRIDDARTGMGD